MKYETVIGLEVHVELATKTKMFCGCSLSFGDEPNSHVCPVCLGLPGSLPVVNEKAIEYAVKFGLAMGSEIPPYSKFDRKNYYYPDLPKGYQISQYDLPICKGGSLTIKAESGSKTINLVRAHLEEDAGKLIHEGKSGRLEDSTGSLADYNRGGTPLLEIVSEPELRSPEEAESYMKALREMVVTLGISDADMEKGHLRCDANISLRPKGAAAYGTRAEIKNVNSFRNVRLALEYEEKRQAVALDKGERIVQETRLWQEREGKTVSMRSKEEAQDYRYFPEPDLPPLRISEAFKAQVRKTLPQLPEEKRQNLAKTYGLSDSQCQVLTAGVRNDEYFEDVMRNFPMVPGSPEHKAAGQTAFNWIMSELAGLRNAAGVEDPYKTSVKPKDLYFHNAMVSSGEISGKMAKEIFQEMFKTGRSPQEIVEKSGMKQISDSGAIVEIVRKVLSENATVVAQYKGGKQGALGFLMGQVMKLSKGQANPQAAKAALEKELG